MIRPTSLVIVVVCLAMLPPGLLADESDRHLSYFSYFLGNWDVKSSKNDEVGRFFVEKGASKRCHLTTFSHGDAVNDGIFAYDPKTRCWTGVVVHEDGSRAVHTFDKVSGDTIKSGDTLEMKVEHIAVDGTKQSVTAQLRIIDDDHFTTKWPETEQHATRKKN